MADARESDEAVQRKTQIIYLRPLMITSAFSLSRHDMLVPQLNSRKSIRKINPQSLNIDDEFSA